MRSRKVGSCPLAAIPPRQPPLPADPKNFVAVLIQRRELQIAAHKLRAGGLQEQAVLKLQQSSSAGCPDPHFLVGIHQDRPHGHVEQALSAFELLVDSFAPVVNSLAVEPNPKATLAILTNALHRSATADRQNIKPLLFNPVQAAPVRPDPKVPFAVH